MVKFLEKINIQYALASILLVYTLCISLEDFPIEIATLFFKATPQFILWGKLTFLPRFDLDICFRECCMISTEAIEEGELLTQSKWQEGIS